MEGKTVPRMPHPWPKRGGLIDRLGRDNVAGLLALLKHRNPTMTERDVKEVVRNRGGQFSAGIGWGVPRWSWFV